jgi:hypothetical protein
MNPFRYMLEPCLNEHHTLMGATYKGQAQKDDFAFA